MLIIATTLHVASALEFNNYVESSCDDLIDLYIRILRKFFAC